MQRCGRESELDSEITNVINKLINFKFFKYDFHIILCINSILFSLFLVWPNFWSFCATIRNTRRFTSIHSNHLWTILVQLQIWLFSTVMTFTYIILYNNSSLLFPTVSSTCFGKFLAFLCYDVNTYLLPYIHSKQLWATLAHLQIWLPSTVRGSQKLGCCTRPLCQLQYAKWRQWQINFDFLSSWQRPNCQFKVITRFLSRYGILKLFTGVIYLVFFFFLISGFVLSHNVISLKDSIEDHEFASANWSITVPDYGINLITCLLT